MVRFEVILSSGRVGFIAFVVVLSSALVVVFEAERVDLIAFFVVSFHCHLS